MIIIILTKYYNTSLVATRRYAPVLESQVYTLRTLEIRDISRNVEPPAAPVINM